MLLNKLQEIDIFQAITINPSLYPEPLLTYSLDALKLLDELNKTRDYINNMKIEIDRLKQVIFNRC